ncbi:MAG: RIO1 family regulatory kinase/ATPase [Nitrososphaerales archaeon]
MRSVETDSLVGAPFSAVLGYPRCSMDELTSRVNELKVNGVHAIIFEGTSMIGKLNVVGKGCVSVVVKATTNGTVIALKIRRTDAGRQTMEREARFLELANKVDVGPKLIRGSKNFLLMEFIDGTSLFRYLEKENGMDSIRKAASEILDQCYRLDEMGLDHGELSDMREHIIIADNGKITIIDFESASTNRRVSNVTASTQYLFIGGAFAKNNRKLLKIRSIDPIIESLREYKKNVSKENFERLKQTLSL